jgi:hypothetical protein
VGGDKQTESSQEERYAKEADIAKFEQLLESRRARNSFWPGAEQLRSPWLWYVVGSGVVGVLLEETVRNTLR